MILEAIDLIFHRGPIAGWYVRDPGIKFIDSAKEGDTRKMLVRLLGLEVQLQSGDLTFCIED